MLDRTGDVADTTMRAIEYAMHGLSSRGDVRANNIANSETPGFRAKTLTFEAQLTEALRNGDVDGVEDVHEGLWAGLADRTGNTVSLEHEVTDMTKDNLMVTAMVNAYNYKVGLLRSAIGGR